MTNKVRMDVRSTSDNFAFMKCCCAFPRTRAARKAYNEAGQGDTRPPQSPQSSVENSKVVPRCEYAVTNCLIEGRLTEGSDCIFSLPQKNRGNSCSTLGFTEPLAYNHQREIITTISLLAATSIE